MFEIQVDTKDILFICGGAFIELEKTIAERYDFPESGFSPYSDNVSMFTLHGLLLQV